MATPYVCIDNLCILCAVCDFSVIICTMYDFIFDRKCMCTCKLTDFDVYKINGLIQCVTVEWLASGKHICVLNTCWKFHKYILWNKKVISIHIVVYLEVSTSIYAFIEFSQIFYKTDMLGLIDYIVKRYWQFCITWKGYFFVVSVINI